jgi:hypothetical protein
MNALSHRSFRRNLAQSARLTVRPTIRYWLAFISTFIVSKNKRQAGYVLHFRLGLAVAIMYAVGSVMCLHNHANANEGGPRRALLLVFSAYDGTQFSPLLGAPESAAKLIHSLCSEGIDLTVLSDCKSGISSSLSKLRRKGWREPTFVELEKEGSDAASVKSRILKWCELQSANEDAGLQLIVFAGHGGYQIDQYCWFTPFDTDGIDVNGLRREVAKIAERGGPYIIISDSCRKNLGVKKMIPAPSPKVQKQYSAVYTEVSEMRLLSASDQSNPPDMVPILYSTAHNRAATDSPNADLVSALAEGVERVKMAKREIFRANGLDKGFEDGDLSLFAWVRYGLLKVLEDSRLTQSGDFEYDRGSLDLNACIAWTKDASQVWRREQELLPFWGENILENGLNGQKYHDVYRLSPTDGDISSAKTRSTLTEVLGGTRKQLDIDPTDKTMEVAISAVGPIRKGETTVKFSIEPSHYNGVRYTDLGGFGLTRSIQIGERKMFRKKLNGASGSFNCLQLSVPVQHSSKPRSEWWPEGVSLVIERIVLVENATETTDDRDGVTETDVLGRWLATTKRVVPGIKRISINAAKRVRISVEREDVNGRAGELLTPAIGGKLIPGILCDKESHRLELTISKLIMLPNLKNGKKDASITVSLQGLVDNETFAIAESPRVSLRELEMSKNAKSMFVLNIDCKVEGLADYLAIFTTGIKEIQIDSIKLVTRPAK